MNLREHFQAIYDDHGHLTPQLVVDLARPKDHPLHDRFEWVDKVAGEAWRRYQAHELIRSVKVVYRPADETSPERSVRAFHAVRQEGVENGGYSYEPVDQIADDPFTRTIVLRDMERDWKALHRRYQDFTEFVDMVRHDLDETAA